jgi:hypothetical protein
MDLAISEADVARSRNDPRFKQILLAKILAQLLDRLNRLQQGANPENSRVLREGAVMAVELADRIRTIDDRLRQA